MAIVGRLGYVASGNYLCEPDDWRNGEAKANERSLYRATRRLG